MNALHITNGDSAAEIIQRTGIPGSVLPWRDILHDGPVPAGLETAALAEVRADFLSAFAGMDRASVLEGIRSRDEICQSWADFDAVVIWLEHDLYDQLQLIQMLDSFGREPLPTDFLSMICIDRFPGVEPFYGLGQLTVEQMATLWPERNPVSAEQIALATKAWAAFRSPTPEALFKLTQGDTGALPFLSDALIRHLEEFPDARTGLSRHERQILRMVQTGTERPGPLFAEHQLLEQAPYFGDWSFWELLASLINTDRPLLSLVDGAEFVYPPGVEPNEAFRTQRLKLTALGDAVLKGEADWVEIKPMDVWKGGVHLSHATGIWRWDAEQQTIVAPS
ncbi:MAG: hypothetical protein ACPG4N_07525 [Gammaproteobacteria bacterium]